MRTVQKALLSVLCCVCLCGCTNGRLSERMIVRSVFMDKVGDKFHIIALTGTQTGSFEELEAWGETQKQALETLDKKSGHELYFGVQRSLYVSERLSRQELRQWAQLMLDEREFLPAVAVQVYPQQLDSPAERAELAQREPETKQTLLQLAEDRDILLRVEQEELAAICFSQEENLRYEEIQAAAALALSGDGGTLYFETEEGAVCWQNADTVLSAVFSGDCASLEIRLMGSIEGQEESDPLVRGRLLRQVEKLAVQEYKNPNSCFDFYGVFAQSDLKKTQQLFAGPQKTPAITALWESGGMW